MNSTDIPNLITYVGNGQGIHIINHLGTGRFMVINDLFDGSLLGGVLNNYLSLYI